MYVVMNKFQVIAGQEDEFERLWRERESYLHEVPGFVHFALLRAEDGEFISHTTWQDHAAFEAWAESDLFRRGHQRGNQIATVLTGHPQLRTYDVVLVQTPSGPAAGPR